VEYSKDDTDAIYAISRTFVAISGFAKLLPVRNTSHQIDLYCLSGHNVDLILHYIRTRRRNNTTSGFTGPEVVFYERP